MITSSWGGGDFGSADGTIYKQFAAQGQTFLNATGDYGAYNSSAWIAPSLDPNILDVGGTDFTTTGPGGSWSSEKGWTGSGGYYKPAGYSTPSYQKLFGVITSTNKASSTYRNDPDVAAEANYDNPTVSNGTPGTRQTWARRCRRQTLRRLHQMECALGLRHAERCFGRLRAGLVQRCLDCGCDIAAMAAIEQCSPGIAATMVRPI